MKRKLTACLGITLLSASLMTGCGSSADSAASSSAESTVQEESSALEESTSSVSESEVQAESAEETVSVSASSEAEEADSEEEDASDAAAEAVLEDGVYTADVDTDSSMFHINEALEGKGTLTVENGEMTIHMTLAGTGILNLYQGTSDEAQEEDAVLLDPVEETVTYSDGTTEDVYAFDVPCPVLDEEFPVALIGKKGKWYDHTVTVSNPVPAE